MSDMTPKEWLLKLIDMIDDLPPEAPPIIVSPWAFAFIERVRRERGQATED